ncbi:hypothetical protein FGG08_001755 [Glutinoglossum americanum]|uniref:Uncharacterized protein n=1 Tax=Glutinoglossum americanum TaxID=1670608 RepID=A0A9P8IE76_9PEZI|nr:hypothetical protein FGG08_001755 [Glutinoglossum americanum]
MPPKRSKPVDSSDPNSSGCRSANKRLRLDATVLSEKSKNSLLRSSAAPTEPQHKRDALEGDGVSSSFSDFLSGPGSPVESDFDKLQPLVVAALERLPNAQDHPDLRKIGRLKTSEDISKLLSAHGWWTPSLIEMFAESTVVTISLLSSTGSLNPSLLLEGFFRQGKFAHLSSLCITGTPLSHQDLAHLRLLPSLAILNLVSTSLSTIHLLHLVTHAANLRDLNISSNPLITDDARVPLSALTALTSLHLRGTSITIPCLRLLVYAIPSTCRFITLPQGCLYYLNTRSRRYCMDIPVGYVQDPREVPNMTLSSLKRNLELHKGANGDIAIGGTKAEAVERLMRVLCGRVADGKIARRVGRGEPNPDI